MYGTSSFLIWEFTMATFQSEQEADRSSAAGSGREPGATRVARLAALGGMQGALGFFLALTAFAVYRKKRPSDDKLVSS